ncbi:MAG: cytochrome c maturation protein CcmE [Candidatus Acidiferrales bacterium]
MKPKAKFTIGAVVIVVTLSCLAWVGARESKTYYHTIPELATLQGYARHQRIRVGGDVKAGTIQHLSGEVDFVLQEQGNTLSVSYIGSDPLPDTFKDGAECLVEGHAASDGRFVADKVQAKCASKYEAAPGANPSGSGEAAGSQNSRS